MVDLSDRAWGLVLAGGGGKGAYQAGVFRALAERGIDSYVTAVSGSSIGALNAILFESVSASVAETIWKEITPKQFLDPELDQLGKGGLVTREGLLDIVTQYVNMEYIRVSERKIYATVTDLGPEGFGPAKAKYCKLNFLPTQKIQDILLASSALPGIYSPIRIDGNICRDGGLTDNLPIIPLYEEGIRHFIVVGLSTDTIIPYENFPEAEFIFIKPEKSIGSFWNGTIDFTSIGAKTRIEIGYIDAVRILDFYGKDMEDPDIKELYEATVERDYRQVSLIRAKNTIKRVISVDKDKINDLLKKYTKE